MSVHGMQAGLLTAAQTLETRKRKRFESCEPVISATNELHRSEDYDEESRLPRVGRDSLGQEYMVEGIPDLPLLPVPKPVFPAPAPTINDLVSILQSTHRTCSTARSYHKALYYSCTHDLQSMSTLLDKLPSFSLQVLWEVLDRAYALIINLSRRTDDYCYERRQLKSSSSRLDFRREYGDYVGAHKELAKRIKCAGFDVFRKVKSQLLTHVKQIFTAAGAPATTIWKNIHKAVMQKIEQASAIVDGISKSFADALKVSKKELKDIVHAFMDNVDDAADDVMDESGDSMDVEHDEGVMMDEASGFFSFERSHLDKAPIFPVTFHMSRMPELLNTRAPAADSGNFTEYLAKQEAAAAVARHRHNVKTILTSCIASPTMLVDSIESEKAYYNFYEHQLRKNERKAARSILADTPEVPAKQEVKPPCFYTAAKGDMQCGVFDGRATFFDRSEDADESGMPCAPVARTRDSSHTSSNLQILSVDYHTAHKDKDVRMADDMLAISMDMQFKKPTTAAVPAALADAHTVSSALAVDDDVFDAWLSSSLDHCLHPGASLPSAAAVFVFFWDCTLKQSSIDSAAFCRLSADSKEDIQLAFMKNIYLHVVQEVTNQFAGLRKVRDDSNSYQVIQRLEKLWTSMGLLFSGELFRFYKLKHRPEGVDLHVNYVTQMLTILHKLEAHLLQQCRLFQQASGLMDAVYSSKAGKVYDLLGYLVCKYLSKKLTFVQTVSSQLTTNQGHVDAMKRVRVLVLLQKSVQQVLEGVTNKFLFESELLYGAVAFIRSQPTAGAAEAGDRFKMGYIHRAEYVLRLFVQAVQVSEKLCKLLFDFVNQTKVLVTTSSPGKYWERVTHVLLMAMNKHSDGMTVSKILDYVHGTVDINAMAVMPPTSTAAAVGSISTEGIWILLTIFHNMSRLLTNKRRAANGWALVKQLTNQAVKHVQTDMRPAFQHILSISSRLAQLSALWDNSFEGFPIFINMLHGAAPVFQHIQTSSLYSKHHAVLLADKGTIARIACAVHCHSPSSGPADADLREQLHQQLLFLVSMLLRSSDLENPYGAYLHRILHTGAVQIAHDVLSIGSLDTLRQHCKELLLHAVLDLEGSGKDGIYSQILIRKLKIPVENALKVLKTVFTSVPCYASGLMVLLVIKEVSNLFPVQVAKDWDLANVMMNLISEATLLPCLTRAGLDGIKSEIAVPSSSVQRSCLLFLAALIIFNPFPNASPSIATATGSAVAALSSFDGYLTHLTAFWAAEASDLATLKPFTLLLADKEMTLTLTETALVSAQCIVHYLHQQMLALFSKQAHLSSGFRYVLPLPCLPMELCRNYLQLVEVLLVFTKSKGREHASTAVYALSTLMQYMACYLDILLPLEDMLRGNVDDVQAHPVHSKLIAYAASNRAVMEHVVGQVDKLLPALRQVDDSMEGVTMSEGLFYVDLQAICGQLAAQKMITLTALTAVNQIYGHAITIANSLDVPFDVPADYAQSSGHQGQVSADPSPGNNAPQPVVHSVY